MCSYMSLSHKVEVVDSPASWYVPSYLLFAAMTGIEINIQPVEAILDLPYD